MTKKTKKKTKKTNSSRVTAVDAGEGIATLTIPSGSGQGSSGPGSSERPEPTPPTAPAAPPAVAADPGVVRRRLIAVVRAEAHVMAGVQSLIHALEVIQGASVDLGPIMAHPAVAEIRRASVAVNQAHAVARSLRERTPGS